MTDKPKVAETAPVPDDKGQDVPAPKDENENVSAPKDDDSEPDGGWIIDLDGNRIKRSDYKG